MNKTSLKITEKLKSKPLKEASDINTVADIPENWAFIQDIAQVDDIKEKYAQVKKTIECDSFYVEVAKDEYLNVYGMIGVVPDINKIVYPIVINGVEYMAEETDEDYEHRHRFEDKADGTFDYKGYKFEIYKKLNGSYSSYDPEAEKTYSYTGVNNADKSWDKKKYLPSKEKAIKREQKDIDAFIEKNKISENKEGTKMKKIFAESYMLEDFDIMSSKEGEGKVSELGGDKYRIAYKNGKISVVGKNIFTDMIDDGYITRVNRKIDEASVPDQHQLKILKDTVINPMKSFLGGPNASEAEKILKTKFKFTDEQIKALKEEVLEPVERNMINEKIVNKVDEYRLTLNPLGGYNWQDKRDGSDNVYKRHFPTKLELEQFITEYFGKRFLNTVKFPEEIKEEKLNEESVEVNKDNYFDLAQGLYWFASDYHSGQNSILYSILSTLEYKPARSENEIDKDNYEGQELYNMLVKLEKTNPKKLDVVAKRIYDDIKGISKNESKETISEASLEKSKYDALVGIIKSLSQDEIESAMEIIGGTLADVEGSDPLRASGAFERAYNEIISAKRKLGK